VRQHVRVARRSSSRGDSGFAGQTVVRSFAKPDHLPVARNRALIEGATTGAALVSKARRPRST